MKSLKIIKIGGSIIDDEIQLSTFLKIFSEIKGLKLLVHGGGKLATQLSERMGVEVKMKDGRRITDDITLDIITMVYGGKINKNIVAKLQANQCNAVGLTGADGNIIEATIRPVKEIDYGFAGDITKVNTDLIISLLEQRIIPVCCPITHNGHGQLLNTNADTIASELAIALSKDYKVELIYIFEKAGVLRDADSDDSIIKEINRNHYSELKNQGVVSEGMIPKLDNCFNALNKGVEKVKIGKMEILSDSRFHYTLLEN